MLDFCSEHNIVCEIERIGIDGVNDALVGAALLPAVLKMLLWVLWVLRLLWHRSAGRAPAGSAAIAASLAAALFILWLPSRRTARTTMHALDFAIQWSALLTFPPPQQCALLLAPILPLAAGPLGEKRCARLPLRD
jgi:hypothetical protein